MQVLRIKIHVLTRES